MPSVLYSMLEFPRWLAELTNLLAMPPLAPKQSDGHTIVVLPGFLCDGQATWPLRSFLTRLGYNVHDWHLGYNLGPSTVGGDSRRLDKELAQYANSKITLIGHSLGGVQAVDYACRHPDKVQQVICLGSPATSDGINNVALALFAYFNGNAAITKESEAPLTVPVVSIYSMTDGVVSYASCITDAFDNVEVASSHCGLVVNRLVYQEIADRLAA